MWMDKTWQGPASGQICWPSYIVIKVNAGKIMWYFLNQKQLNIRALCACANMLCQMAADKCIAICNIYIYMYILITIKVSGNDRSHLAGTLQKKNIEIKEMKKKMFLKSFLRLKGKVTRWCAVGDCSILDAATENELSPTVVRRVQWTNDIDDDAERSLHRDGESAMLSIM